MPNIESSLPDLEGTLRLMEALSAPLRFEVLAQLRRHGPMRLAELTEKLRHKQATPTNVFGHLEVLKHLGLVTTRRQGRAVIFSVEEGVGRLLDGLRRLVGQRNRAGGRS